MADPEQIPAGRNKFWGRLLIVALGLLALLYLVVSLR
ncbi:MAG: hypothetical protein JWO33_2911 [Caulobacteraceae bacterium]|nr:hypothetical protein [Caulobacteraceae bacterium]